MNISDNSDNKNKQKKSNELLTELFIILGCDPEKQENILDVTFDSDTLKDKNLIDKLYSLQDKFKSDYNSSSLTCLHKNSINKQKFPAINFIRQILKCNNYKLYGFYISNGYNKQNGGKKNLKRYYKIKEIE